MSLVTLTPTYTTSTDTVEHTTIEICIPTKQKQQLVILYTDLHSDEDERDIRVTITKGVAVEKSSDWIQRFNIEPRPTTTTATITLGQRNKERGTGVRTTAGSSKASTTSTIESTVASLSAQEEHPLPRGFADHYRSARASRYPNVNSVRNERDNRLFEEATDEDDSEEEQAKPTSRGTGVPITDLATNTRRLSVTETLGTQPPTQEPPVESASLALTSEEKLKCALAKRSSDYIRTYLTASFNAWDNSQDSGRSPEHRREEAHRAADTAWNRHLEEQINSRSSAGKRERESLQETSSVHQSKNPKGDTEKSAEV
jgi:hypothetical protein